MFIRIVVFIILLLQFSICPGYAFFGSNSNTGEYTTLDEMAGAFASQIKERYAGRRLALFSESIRDQNDAVLPFARQLADSLESSLTKAGFSFAGGVLEKEDIQLDVSYIVEPDKLQVTARTKDDTGGYRTIKGSLHRSGYANQLFVEGVDERIGRLARKLSASWTRAQKLKLLVQPVLNAGIGNSSPFAEHATSTMVAALKRENTIDLLMKDASASRTRSISPSLPLECGDAFYSGVDAVLRATVQTGSDGVILNAAIKDRNCRVIATDSITMPRSMITLTLADDSITTTALYADIQNQSGGEMVHISTTRGGGHQVFYEGEIYTLTALVKVPLYIYLYDIYPDGKKIEPIYPLDGDTEILRQPGVIYEIPEETEKGAKGILVTPGDYGTDVIKVFASDKKLPLPKLDTAQQVKGFTSAGTRGGVRPKIQAELAGRAVINPADLVDYYRGVAAKKGAKLYETSIFVETRPRK